MGRTNWIAGLALLGALVGGTDATADTSSRPAVRVKLLDELGAPEETVLEAQREASSIFERAGINLAWIPAEEPSAGSLILKIVDAPIGRISRNAAVLGVAAGSKEGGRVAYVFYPRIDDLRQLFGLRASLLLGHVIAHELGHLLLGYGAHAATGIMKGGWDRNQTIAAQSGTLTFQSDQTRLIRSRLEGRR